MSDSHDPEFGTGENANIVREAINKTKQYIFDDHLKGEFGELKYIVDVAEMGPSAVVPIPLSEKELRIIRFCMNRALETI